MPTWVHVNDLGESGLEPFRSVRDRDLAGRQNLFMVEGEVALRVLIEHGRYELASLLLSERRVSALKGLLEGLPSDRRVYVIPHHDIESVVGFKMHRGILGCGHRHRNPTAHEVLAALPESAHRLLLGEAVSNTDNMGGLFRNVAAFGGEALLFDHQSCDPLYRKAIRVSSGQSLALPFSRGGHVLDLIAAVQAAGFTVAALTPKQDATPIKAWRNRPQKIAILVGAEGPGLSEAALAAADVSISIPMAPAVDSLNMATSVAVALHTLAE